MAERLLYLVRHGDADGHRPESALTDLGRRQADAAGTLLAPISFTSFHHSPLRRAAETAAIIAAHLPGAEPQSSPIVGDLMPSDPATEGLPPRFAVFRAGFSDEERTIGPSLAAQAIARFAGEPGDDATELIVTHNFTIGWFVSHALAAPDWAWLTLNQTNAAITIIRYRGGLPPALVSFNDGCHLPADPVASEERVAEPGKLDHLAE